ncbi:MAG: lactoylglutathione lyase [Deltaproteobacteria bacterium]
MRFLHTMIRVGDLERAIKFYTDVLGLTLLSRADYPEGRFTIAFLGNGEGKEPFLELTHNWDTAAYNLGNGWGHIAMATPDIYAACEGVQSAGGKITRPPGPMKHGTTVIAFIEDADGYKIELVETA